MRNRLSAKLCRERKKQKFGILEAKAQQLEIGNVELEAVVTKLLQENELLRITLAQLHAERLASVKPQGQSTYGFEVVNDCTMCIDGSCHIVTF